MDNEAQRIAIAEACGWTEIKNVYILKIGGWWLGYPPVNPIIGQKIQIPDYLNDLNAMRVAECSLKAHQEVPFLIELSSTFGITEKFEEGVRGKADIYLLVCSSAQQRAEAFLKAIEKWEDEK